MVNTAIEFGTPVEDKNGKTIGQVDHIVMDSWSGEPRKYIIRLGDDGSAVYFAPGDIAEAAGEKVKLNVTFDEMERT